MTSPFHSEVSISQVFRSPLRSQDPLLQRQQPISWLRPSYPPHTGDRHVDNFLQKQGSEVPKLS